MPISVTCRCGAMLRTADSAAGKTFACPKCKARVQVPPSAGAPVQVSKDPPRSPALSKVIPVDQPEPAKPQGVPPLVLVGVISLAVIVVVGGVVGVLLLKDRGVGDSMAAGPVPPGVAPAADGYALGQEIRFGDLGVTVVRARVEKYVSLTSIGQPVLHDPAVVVRIGIRNYNPNRIAEAGAQTGVATLTDNLGNRYERVSPRSDIGLPTSIPGQTPAGTVVRLRSDEAEEDVLLFDRPVPGASSLELRLDGSRYESSGSVKVIIPLKPIYKVQIQANQPWQDTGLDAIAGSQITIIPDGVWSKKNSQCSWAGFPIDKDPKQILLRQLENELFALGAGAAPQPVDALINPRAGINKHDAEPVRRSSESQEKWEKRLREYEKKQEVRKEASRLAAERQTRREELNKRIQAEQNGLKRRQLETTRNLMCLMARIGPKGSPFVVQKDKTFESNGAGRLYFQANDLNLQENSGSVDVDIVLIR